MSSSDFLKFEPTFFSTHWLSCMFMCEWSCVRADACEHDLHNIRPNLPGQRHAVDRAIDVRLGCPAIDREARLAGGGAEVEAVGDIAAQGVVNHQGRLFAPLLELGALGGEGRGREVEKISAAAPVFTPAATDNC